jgi:hypothetical protein
VLDLRVFILTHPASSWDVEEIVKDTLAAFSGVQGQIEVEVFSNTVIEAEPLTSYAYLKSALFAQQIIGSDRLKRHFSMCTLSWHIRQVIANLSSLAKLVLKDYRNKVRAESHRAAVISAGHLSMWQKAALKPSKLYLFLEDDVTIVNPKMLAEVTKSLLDLTRTDSLFVCDTSHSFTLDNLGIDRRSSRPAGSADSSLRIFDFPFTNTLAATFFSRELLEAVLLKSFSLDGLNGLGADLDLSRIMLNISPLPTGCMSQEPAFRQQSQFKSQRI